MASSRPPTTQSLDALQPLLPDGCGFTLVVDFRSRTLFQHTLNGSTPSTFVEKFTPSELRLFLSLYEAYPKGCSTEYLLSVLHSTPSQQVEGAQQGETSKQELRRLRDAMKKIRLKLYPFSLTIATVHVAEVPISDAGYQLASLSLFDGEEKE